MVKYFNDSAPKSSVDKIGAKILRLYSSKYLLNTLAKSTMVSPLVSLVMCDNNRLKILNNSVDDTAILGTSGGNCGTAENSNIFEFKYLSCSCTQIDKYGSNTSEISLCKPKTFQTPTFSSNYPKASLTRF